MRNISKAILILITVSMAHAKINNKQKYDAIEARCDKGENDACAVFKNDCESGVVYACVTIALKLQDVGNFNGAAQFYQKGCQLGNAEACKLALNMVKLDTEQHTLAAQRNTPTNRPVDFTAVMPLVNSLSQSPTPPAPQQVNCQTTSYKDLSGNIVQNTNCQ